MKDIDVQVCTLNARGLRTKNKRQMVFKWLNDKKYDIIMLQETYCTRDFERHFNRTWNGPVYHSVTDSFHSRGVSILIKKSLNLTICDIHKDNEGRLLLLNGKLNDQSITLVSAYAPNMLSARVDFLKQMGRFIERYSSDDNFLILGGDLNTIDDKRDRSSGIVENCSQHFTAFKTFVTVKDVWRENHRNEVEYSFIDSRCIGSMSRIDYIMCSNHLIDSVKSSTITCAPVPDHRAVTAHFFTQLRPRGKGYWKLNTAVLKDPNYVEGIKDIITQTQNEYADTDLPKRTVWDLIKIRIK